MPDSMKRHVGITNAAMYSLIAAGLHHQGVLEVDVADLDFWFTVVSIG